MGVFTRIGWLIRGAVVYTLYWAFGYIVAGIIFTPRPVPLPVLLLVTVGVAPVTIAAVRKEYRMSELERYREWERQGERVREMRRKADEEWRRSILNPANAYSYWRRGEG